MGQGRRPCVQVEGTLRRLVLLQEPSGEKRQHRLWVVRKPPPASHLCYVYCKDCGAYAGNKARGLLHPCEGRLAKTFVQMRYFRRGRDPRSNKLLGSAPWALHEGVPEWWTAMATAARGPEELRAEEQLLAEEGVREPPGEQADASGSEDEGAALARVVSAGLDDSSVSTLSEPEELEEW